MPHMEGPIRWMKLVIRSHLRLLFHQISLLPESLTYKLKLLAVNLLYRSLQGRIMGHRTESLYIVR